MADNLNNINPFGKPKINAWNWLLSNYGIVFTFFCLVFPYAYVQLWGTLQLLMPAILSIGIASLCIGYGTVQYKNLVDTNMILPFNRSQLSKIFSANK